MECGGKAKRRRRFGLGDGEKFQSGACHAEALAKEGDASLPTALQMVTVLTR